MNGFDESWLRDYQLKRAREKLPRLDEVHFVLAKPIRTLNELIRMHWRDRGRYAKKLSAEIATLHTGIGEPFQRARVEITRYSIQEPDADGLTGGAKPLIDCLLVRSARHPHGLGYLVDDSPAHMELVVRHEKAEKRKDQRTVVKLTRLT